MVRGLPLSSPNHLATQRYYLCVKQVLLAARTLNSTLRDHCLDVTDSVSVASAARLLAGVCLGVGAFIAFLLGEEVLLLILLQRDWALKVIIYVICVVLH